VVGNPAFGARIRELRLAKVKSDPNFILRRFAEAVDLSPTFISKMERGDFDPPRAEKVKKMAELLDVSADELLALANKVDPDLETIIKEQPSTVPDLLRTVRGMSDKDLRNLTEYLRKNKDS
jgi:HTH-type transcriptional regulator, competence development regulator